TGVTRPVEGPAGTRVRVRRSDDDVRAHGSDRNSRHSPRRFPPAWRLRRMAGCGSALTPEIGIRVRAGPLPSVTAGQQGADVDGHQRSEPDGGPNGGHELDQIDYVTPAGTSRHVRFELPRWHVVDIGDKP